MEISGEQALIDLSFLILCLRVIYISVTRGILGESFKIGGLFVGALFAFHYYFSLGNYISKKILFLGKDYPYLVSFLLILLSIGVVFSLLRSIVTLLFKKEEISVEERWVSVFIGGFRAIFLSSVVIFLLHQSPLDLKFIRHTVSYRMFKKVAPKIYLVYFEFYRKANPKAILNKEVKKYYEAKKSL